MTRTTNSNRPDIDKELFLLRAVKPSDLGHMGLFLGCFLAWRGRHYTLHITHYTVRFRLKNLYKMLDLNRHPLQHTTSRRSAPLGDPRGIPKLSERFSQSKSYLRLGDGAVTSVHSLKFEGPVNIIIARTGPRRIYFQVNIHISKMSDFVGSDLSLLDGLLERIGNSTEFISEEGAMPFLNIKELDYTSDFDVNMFNEPPSLPSSSSDGSLSDILPSLVDPSPEYTVVLKIPDDIDLLAEDVLAPSFPESSLQIDPQAQEEARNPLVSKADIDREKNNKASREYRQRKKSKLAALEEEEKELEAKNRLLRMQEASMQDIVDRLKSKLVSVLANERPRLKRHQEENFDMFAKKSRL